MKNKQLTFINVIRLLFAVNIIYLMLVGEWVNVMAVTGALAASFFPQIIKWLTKIETPGSFNLFGIIFIILSQWAGTYLRAYDIFPWWDVFLHGLSAILIGLFGLILIAWIDKKAVLFENQAYGLVSLIVFLTACSSAVWWEMCEYWGDTYLGTNAQLGSLVDTMEDMIICVVIGLVFSGYLYYTLTKKKESYLAQEATNFIDKNKKQDV
ncbi:MAG: hypothetical protein ACRC1P_06040 [Cellulosilyticaceae bacterium]